MASFPSSSSKMGSDTGLLLEEEATDLTTYGFDMLSSARSSGDGEEEEEEEEEEGAADGQIYRQNGHYGGSWTYKLTPDLLIKQNSGT